LVALAGTGCEKFAGSNPNMQHEENIVTSDNHHFGINRGQHAHQHVVSGSASTAGSDFELRIRPGASRSDGLLALKIFENYILSGGGGRWGG
jgi:hypothetical protein